MASEGLHERFDDLTPETRDRHRAIVSLMEELEAIDWYQQRVDGASDPELKDILAHNRDEEIEHAAMVLEWLRRRMPKFDEELGTYLNTEERIAGLEIDATGGNGGDPDTPTGTLGIGSLKE